MVEGQLVSILLRGTGVAALLAVGGLAVGSPAPGLQAAGPASGAPAAAPWIVIFHGLPLPARVVIADWHENQRLMLALAEPVGPFGVEPGAGAYVEVALFWGPEWANYPRDSASLARLRPDQASQRARFYPATGERAALWVFRAGLGGSGPVPPAPARGVTPAGLSLLEARGIPVRVALPAPQPARPSAPPA